MFTKPLFSNNCDIRDGMFIISQQDGKLMKMFGYHKNDLLWLHATEKAKPLYLIRIKTKEFDADGYRLAS